MAEGNGLEARGRDASRHLFVYGTLVDPAVRRSVLGHDHAGEVLRARLGGYGRDVLAEGGYAVATPRAGSTLDGMLLMDLDPRDWPALDAYEDVGAGTYARASVEVEVWGCGPRPARVMAQAYVAGPALARASAPSAPSNAD